MRCLIAAILLASCASQPTPRPDDMSAEAHRLEADRERAAARETAAIPPRELQSDPLVATRWNQIVAEARVRHAAEHERAAAELQRFEETECKQIPPGERAACPLLIGAGALVDVEGGVEVRFLSGAPVDDVERRMRCHHAYARARGYADIADCPLYMKGLEIRRVDPRIIRITGPDVDRIRRRSRELVAPAPPPNAGLARPRAIGAPLALEEAGFRPLRPARSMQ